MKIDWDQFKSFCTKRKIDILLVEQTSTYYLYAAERNVQIECEIDRYPSDTTILDDFEDNYKSLCNPESLDKVTPRAPANDYEMKPYGLCHAHIDSSSNYIYDITLSNKNNEDYDYSCTVDPTGYDCVCSSNTTLLDEIEEVDAVNKTIETFEGRLANGAHKLIRPCTINFKFPDEYPLYQLWGLFVHIKDFGEDDHMCLQIVDVDNILGYGNNFVLKEYDEVWVQTAAKTNSAIYSPDNAPGELPAGVYGVILYYPKDITKTDIKVWIDYILTIKS